LQRIKRKEKKIVEKEEKEEKEGMGKEKKKKKRERRSREARRDPIFVVTQSFIIIYNSIKSHRTQHTHLAVCSIR
jgi:hypothetical protein